MFTGEGDEWPASPLLHGVAGWGVTRLASLPRGGAAIHTCVILALATSHPDNMSLKIVVISLIKGDPFFMTHVCKLDFVSQACKWD